MCARELLHLTPDPCDRSPLLVRAAPAQHPAPTDVYHVLRPHRVRPIVVTQRSSIIPAHRANTAHRTPLSGAPPSVLPCMTRPVRQPTPPSVCPSQGLSVRWHPVGDDGQVRQNRHVAPGVLHRLRLYDALPSPQLDAGLLHQVRQIRRPSERPNLLVLSLAAFGSLAYSRPTPTRIDRPP